MFICEKIFEVDEFGSGPAESAFFLLESSGFHENIGAFGFGDGDFGERGFEGFGVVVPVVYVWGVVCGIGGWLATDDGDFPLFDWGYLVDSVDKVDGSGVREVGFLEKVKRDEFWIGGFEEWRGW